MSFIEYFRKNNKKSASIAKERLQIIVAHERRALRQFDFLPEMQREILAVVQKYVSVANDDVSVNVEDADDCSVLELNINLPENAN